jgi:23S rRNA (cytosine1962-C5)-methyltransferase
MTKVFLKKKIQNRVLQGHPWIFGNEVGDIQGPVEAGDIVDVFTHQGFFVGRGYINPQSQILVRLLTRDKNEQINDDFFYRRLLKAWQYRQKL